MSLRNVANKTAIYAKLVTYLVKQVALALSEFGTYGYVKTKDMRYWVLKHLKDFIPTKIDDAIINTAIKIDSKTADVLDKLHDKIANKLKDNSEWTNLILDLNNTNKAIEVDRTARQEANTKRKQDKLRQMHIQGNKDLSKLDMNHLFDKPKTKADVMLKQKLNEAKKKGKDYYFDRARETRQENKSKGYFTQKWQGAQSTEEKVWGLP